jgi:hypothetical protein
LRELLHEARDLLHHPRFVPVGSNDPQHVAGCPGCRLEEQIDRVLDDDGGE